VQVGIVSLECLLEYFVCFCVGKVYIKFENTLILCYNHALFLAVIFSVVCMQG
jgi:hypothetical protein